MAERRFPDWIDWELELSPHVLRRMAQRRFGETDLRGMLTRPAACAEDVEQGRWILSANWEGESWEVVVEPDPAIQRLVVVTAYRVE
ncbi:MAG TPA: DUF4258 domain-containing protein [Phycisphaerae bacterium]|nr:DUF4258 domain-containing protein [Phycisphaerae bacterium]